MSRRADARGAPRPLVSQGRRIATRPGRIVVAVRAPAELRDRRAALAGDARRALRFLGEAACELSIALVDDREIASLNHAYRGKDRPTDVLSFAQREGEDVAPGLLGDVVISFDTAARQARRRGARVEDELRHLLVHGLLHLLGYDHERSPADARRMFRRARDVLAFLRSPAPRARRAS